MRVLNLQKKICLISSLSRTFPCLVGEVFPSLPTCGALLILAERIVCWVRGNEFSTWHNWFNNIEMEMEWSNKNSPAGSPALPPLLQNPPCLEYTAQEHRKGTHIHVFVQRVSLLIFLLVFLLFSLLFSAYLCRSRCWWWVLGYATTPKTTRSPRTHLVVHLWA